MKPHKRKGRAALRKRREKAKLWVSDLRIDHFGAYPYDPKNPLMGGKNG